MVRVAWEEIIEKTKKITWNFLINMFLVYQDHIFMLFFSCGFLLLNELRSFKQVTIPGSLKDILCPSYAKTLIFVEQAHKILEIQQQMSG